MIGAGAAGLTAAAELAEAGLSVIVLEARDRTGGRIFPVKSSLPGRKDRRPGSNQQFPIQLGAEFIHGRPVEIVNLLRRNKIPLREVKGDNWCLENGRIVSCDFLSEADEILQQMNDDGPDQSFDSFLRRCCPGASKDAKQRARRFVAGFNAADPAQVGVHWLVRQMRAEEKIKGDRAFRARGGYAVLLELFRKRVAKAGVNVRINAVVNRIAWARGTASIHATCNGKRLSLTASRVLVTVPIGVLRARSGAEGAIEFSPALPRNKLKAIAGIEMGKVVRVVLQFRDRFWQRIHPSTNQKRTLAKMSFLFSEDKSEDKYFSTWWTAMPDKFPILTAWGAAECAERIAADDLPAEARALRSIAQLLGVGSREIEPLLQASHFHDWQGDPYSRGAYSYVKAGAADAPRILGQPVEDTLYFAGEAADVSGNNGTVHAAIFSAQRAVEELLRYARRSAG